ncbi:hypothetical protein [Marivirga arenosa]|uniref:Uncharacterized protein n=1 Tax=Marivirga arenosa TaxID=3059076 RepID=A0AA51ZXT8_9BACT|nr:hypothetical protein [Marivirga sp. BKB1-2]WNB18685.1 hypothetical protein QYS47_30970 [Marivirga sp. BKB1-2]
MRRIICFFFFLNLIACTDGDNYKSQLNGSCPDVELQQIVKDSLLEYSVNLPAEYAVYKNYGDLSLASVKPTELDNYIESFGLTIEQNSMNYRLNEFYKNGTYWDQEEYERDFDDFSMVTQGKTMINDVEYKYNIYTYGNEQVLRMFGISNNLTYSLMFLSNQEDFDSLFCKYVNIAQTLKIGQDSL